MHRSRHWSDVRLVARQPHTNEDPRKRDWNLSGDPLRVRRSDYFTRVFSRELVRVLANSAAALRFEPPTAVAAPATSGSAVTACTRADWLAAFRDRSRGRP